jgi:regulator of sirC expression with transglutaminase-like and TPR domain
VENPEKNKELNALISLIDEPSEEMYSSIRDKISSYGKVAIPLLEEAWLHAAKNEDVERIETLIDDIRMSDLYFELNNWSQFYSNDLVKAFVLLTKFRYPDLDEEKYLEKINKMRQNIWLEINQDLTALEKIKVLNHIFFDIYQFRGQLPQHINLNAYFLNDLLDSKKGSAIALGILYISIAQSLDIPIFGVDLHHHFALAYMDDTVETKAAGDYKIEEVLFYIAVVNKGSVFTKNEIRRYVRQMKIEEQPEFFLPCNNTHIIRRLINEMISAYKKESKYDKSELLVKLLEALD